MLATVPELIHVPSRVTAVLRGALVVESQSGQLSRGSGPFTPDTVHRDSLAPARPGPARSGVYRG